MTHVQAVAGVVGSGTSTVATGSFTSTAGNCMAVIVSTASSVTSCSLVNVGGDSWVAHSANPLTAGAVRGWAFYAQNLVGHIGDLITATLSGADSASLVMDEFSGVLTASILDTSFSGTDGSNTTSHSAGSAATTGGNSDIWAGNAEDLASGTAVHTAGSGWTKGSENNDANSYATSVTQYRVAQPQGTYTNASTTSAASRFAGLVFAFKNTGWAASGGAAVLSSPTPSGTLGTSTTATLGCTTDTSSGTLYGVVDTAANISGITAAQVKLGQNKNSVAAVASGNSAVSTSTPSVAVSGLTQSTAYSYAEAQDTGSNSNVVTGTFTTAAGAPPPTSIRSIFVMP